MDEQSKRSGKARLRRRGPVASRRVLAALGILVVTLSAPTGALAAAGGSTGSFSVVPIAAPGGLSYFRFQLAPGGVAHGAVAVVGQGTGVVPVNVFAAQGVTAQGSGDAYVAPSAGRCAGASCWITDLPGQLKLTNGQRQEVNFTVSVPKGTPSGQYLAGVGVGQVPPSTTTTTAKSHKGPSAVTTIDRQVVIGVEITVGSGYSDVLRIEKVTGTRIGNSAGVVVTEAEVGHTIEHPKGAVVIGKGHTARTFSAVSGTLLAGGVTGLRILAPGVTSGSYPASAYLRYDNGTKVARWSGVVTIPAPAPSKAISVPPHSHVVVVVKGWPGWVVGVLAAAGALLVAALLYLFVTLRRRQAGEHSSSP